MITTKMIISFKNKQQEQITDLFGKEECHMPLSMMEQGDTRMITEFRGQEEMKRHLQDLGFIKGERVRVVGENPSGMILMVKGVKIALNRALANRIMVAD